MPKLVHCAVAVALCFASNGASVALAATKQMPQKPTTLKGLAPQTDKTFLPDAADVFDSAVREYSAGHMQRAEVLFKKCLELDPDNADAHYNLGAIAEWRKDYAGAVTEYQAAQRLRPGDADIQQALSQAMFKVKNRGALEREDQKLKREQELAMHGQLAKEAFSSQNYVEAIGHLTRLVEAMPEDAKVQFALGQSLRALKYYDWAAYRLKMAIYLDPDNDLYRQAIADLDTELDTAQQQAFSESAQMAINKMARMTSSEVAQDGPGTHAF